MLGELNRHSGLHDDHASSIHSLQQQIGDPGATTAAPESSTSNTATAGLAVAIVALSGFGFILYKRNKQQRYDKSGQEVAGESVPDMEHRVEIAHFGADGVRYRPGYTEPNDLYNWKF